MSKEDWNIRYGTGEYLYGTEPNQYLKQVLEARAPGICLFPAEGEGRNAVYAALKGWTVDAFDQSEVAREKALQLAAVKGAGIHYEVCSLDDWTPHKQYDLVGLFYVHLQPETRREVHRRMINALKPGGIIVAEAFTRNQLPRTSGGPKNYDLLFDATEFLEDFKELEVIESGEFQILLDEGTLHKGIADVVRFTGQKKSRAE